MMTFQTPSQDWLSRQPVREPASRGGPPDDEGWGPSQPQGGLSVLGEAQWWKPGLGRPGRCKGVGAWAAGCALQAGAQDFSESLPTQTEFNTRGQDEDPDLNLHPGTHASPPDEESGAGSSWEALCPPSTPEAKRNDEDRGLEKPRKQAQHCYSVHGGAGLGASPHSPDPLIDQVRTQAGRSQGRCQSWPVPTHSSHGPLNFPCRSQNCPAQERENGHLPLPGNHTLYLGSCS